MNRAISMTVAAGVLAFALAAGTAQAAPAGAGVLGKLATASTASTQVEKTGWHKRRHWRKRCIRRCMWRSGRSYYRCRRICSRR